MGKGRQQRAVTIDDRQHPNKGSNGEYLMKDTKVHIKAVDGDSITVVGYGVVFGGKDLVGESFSPETDFQLDLVPKKPVFYDHRLAEIKSHLGVTDAIKQDEFGLWLEAQLDRSKDYIKEILELIEKGVLGWSSGSVPHLVDVLEGGKIKTWPIVEFSLTPTPAEPRTLGVQHLRTALEAAGIDVPANLLAAEESTKDIESVVSILSNNETIRVTE